MMRHKSNDHSYSPKATALAILIPAVLLGVAGSGRGDDGASDPRGTGYDLSWFTVDGGGVMFSAGGEYELSGTIGQPDAGGPMVGPAESGYELTGGFWFAQVPGDCVFDGAVNLLDHAAFIGCLAGPTTMLIGDDCRCFDLDADYDVDLVDFGLFQRQFNGS